MTDEEDLSIEQVDQILLSWGIDPVGFREFAREVVGQEVAQPLHDKPYTQRIIALRERVDVLIGWLKKAGAKPEDLASVLEGVISGLYQETHQFREGHSAKRNQQEGAKEVREAKPRRFYRVCRADLQVKEAQTAPPSKRFKGR